MKRILILLLFMGLGQQLKAQEEFLKLDSVVVLQGQLSYVSGSHQYYPRYAASDSVICPSNGIIKVRNVLLDAREITINEEGRAFKAQDDIEILSFNCQMNGITISNINDMSNGAFFNKSDYSIGGERFKMYSLRDINLIQSGDLEFIIESKSQDYTSSSSMEFRYRIELVYYSYEN